MRKRVIVFRFVGDDKNRTIEDINKLYEDLLSAKRKGDIIISAPSDIKNLVLKYIDLLQKVKDSNPLLAFQWVSCTMKRCKGNRDRTK